jgi:PAS domain S-box-containing protein
LHRGSPLARRLLFAAVLFASALVREGDGVVLGQAVIWLPSGLAVAGLWLLGLGEWWVVALCTVAQRVAFGYDPAGAVLAAAGSTAEAVLGVAILSRLRFDAAFARLRDFLAVVAAAAAAPVASILASWVGRAIVWTDPNLPLYARWGGWWRMNALGVLAVVPVAATFLAPSAEPRRFRRAAAAALAALGTAVAVVAAIRSVPEGVTGIMLLTLVLPVSLYAGMRCGPRGAASSGALAALVVAVATQHGMGPFVDLAPPDRHAALQAFELMLVAVPLAFAALVAEREGARAREEQAETRRRALESALPDVTYRIRRDGVCLDLFVPEEGEAPLRRSQVVGRDVREVLEPERADEVGRTIERVLSERTVVTTEYPLVVEGRRHVREARCVPYGDDEILAVVRDITDRKELEEQLRQSQKMDAVGKLAGGVAHDFNNLLTAIYGYAEAVADAAPAEGPIRAQVRQIREAAERAAGLTRQLLAYSRQQVLRPRILEPAAVVEQLGEMLRRVIGEDVRLVTRHESPEARIRADRSQLEQVILNLVVNARDAMPEGGEIRVETRAVNLEAWSPRPRVDLRPGRYVTILVRDTGKGMTPEVQARAFDPFFTTKEPGKGTGLGLSTVYGIVKQSDGAVWLDSEPGAGTSAWILFPRVEATLEAEEEPKRPSPDRHEATVLVVEDETVVRDLLREALEGAGYRVLDASDGEEALRVAGRHPGAIDLLVTDVVMPRLGGRALANRLLSERPGMRVIFMSGYSNDARDLPEFAGTADFLQKPFPPSHLVDRVRSRLASEVVGGGPVRA